MKAKLCAAIALAAGAALARTSTPEGWTDDYKKALERASEEGKYVVADFSGSDWCGWCKKLDKEVFSTDEFRKTALEKYVMLMVDTPNDESLLSEQAKKQNPQLLEKYEVPGFPTVLVLDPAGNVVSSLGYKKGGPAKYLKSIEKAIAANFHSWAPTPPMGWNSWDCYGSMVDEAAYRANADWQAENLLRFGYEYCVIDIRWTLQNETSAYYNQSNPVYTLDEFGRYLPDPGRFPSSVTKDGRRVGFKPLADYVHSKGLKFGIHIMRGVPKEAVARKCPVKGADGVTCDMIGNNQTECGWLRDNCTVEKGRPGAQEYYDSIVALYAEWGVDFIKCDDLSFPYRAGEVEMLRNAIDKCGRKIVLSTSPGETPLDRSSHVAANANMWRMVGDLWDHWGAVDHLTDVTARWIEKPSVPGAWADCDMVPLGRLCVRAYGGARDSRLTMDESRYLMTLMCIARSPLMLGSDLPSLAKMPEMLALLTDKELLEVHRNGRNPKTVSCTREECVIRADAPGGKSYVALFNRTGEKRTVRGCGVEVELAPHSAALKTVQ